MCWAVQPDGAPHTYVIDLRPTTWTETPSIRGLRLDPLASPGTIAIEQLALIPDAGQPGVA